MSEELPYKKDHEAEELVTTAQEVIDFYSQLENAGIKIWIDGGWSVDALVGKQLRPHRDTDIAIQWKDVPQLREMLEARGFKQVREDSKWNFVLADKYGHEIDVHAFVYDEEGHVVDGIMYPAESLNGEGIIEGQAVRCISPEHMVEFLAPWISKWPEKYVPAVAAICEKYELELPQEYRDYIEANKS